MKQNLYFVPDVKKVYDKPNPRGAWKFETLLFQKYFPKYLRSLELSSKTASVKSKVKRTKVIQRFSSLCPSNRSEWRHLLANKFKTVKALSTEGQSSHQFIEKIKLFSKLTSLHILPKPGQFSGDSRPHLLKACRKMLRLKNLKSIIIDKPPDESASFFQELNAYPKLLRSLQQFGIFFSSKRHQDDELLHTMKKCKNLLKYVKTLQLFALRSPSHLESFQALADSCPNLTSLSFEFSCRNITYSSMHPPLYSNQRFPVEINYLEALKTFHNLKWLELKIADTLTFLKDFTCPSSIENLRLNFEECLTKEIMLKIDPHFKKKAENQILEVFETNQTLKKFYENFQHLHNLKSLQIIFSSDFGPVEYQHQHYLVQGILKNIPSVEKLSLLFRGTYSGLNQINTSPVKDFYLSQFFQSCYHFRQALQTLEIGDEKLIFTNVNLLSSANKFPNLSTIGLTGVIEKRDPSNANIYAFLKQVMPLGSALTTVKLNTWGNSSVKSLLSLLQQLNKLEKPEKLQIQLQIKFFDWKSLEDLRTGFENIIKDLQEDRKEYAKLQGISLKFVTDYSYPSNSVKKFVNVYGKKFENFFFSSIWEDDKNQ